MGQIAKIRDEYPHRNSPVACAFEAEIKRYSIESGLTVGAVMQKLSEFVNVDIRQLYNYRSGKTDIPATCIPQFCKQFKSNALAMAIVAMCNQTEFEDRDALDLTKFCSETIRETLAHGADFIEAFDDGSIDGRELSKLTHGTAKVIRNANRLLEVARAHYDRRHAAAPEAA